MAHFDEEELKSIKPGPILWMASHPVAANLLMVILLIGGFMLLTQTKKEVFPEFSLDIITTTMVYPGASPEEVEQGILLPIEDAIKDVDGISNIKSTAFEGYGHVIAELDDPSESIRVSQDIKTAVDQIQTFPIDAENLTVSLLTNEERVMDVVLFGSVDDLVLRETAEMVRARMEQDDGLDLIELAAVRNYEVHIEVSQENLRRYGLNIPDIATIVGRTSVELGGGGIKTAAGEILVRMTERRDYAADFADIPILQGANGSAIYLGDIAKISDNFEDRSVFAHYNGKPAIELQLNSTADQSPIDVSRAARDVIDTLNQTMPGDLELVVTSDRSIMFEQRAELLMKNGLLGLFLVVVFLALFLDIRLAFWVSLGIPISYMGAFVLFSPLDVSINMVSMFAFIIALGIVVDDAVVVGENIYHKRESGMKPLEAAVTGAREMSIPVSVSILTNVVAFLPMLFMPGFMGKIFSIVPMIVISTFILSLIESLFILPAHLTFRQSKTIKNRALLNIVNFQKAFNRKFNLFIDDYYIPALRAMVAYRYICLSLFLFLLITIGGYVASGRLAFQMFPKVESDFSYAHAELPVGAPDDAVLLVEQKMIDAAQSIITEHGGQTLSFGVYSQVDENEITIRSFLTAPETRTMSTDAFTSLWRTRTGDINGVETLVFASDFGGPGAGADLNVEISHHDTDILKKAAHDLVEELSDFPGTQDIQDGTAQGKRQFDFTMTDLGYTLGLNPVEIGRQVRGAFYGSEALKQQRGRHEVRTLVLLPEEERSSAYAFKNMMIKAPSGEFVMLNDVVDATDGRAYTTIDRREGRRVITIESDVEPASETNKILAALRRDVLPALQQKYPGLTYSFEGEQADMRDSLQSLFMGMFAVLFVMYAILAVLFSSYAQPLMIMIAIPFSMVGAIIGHYIMGFSLSIVSMFGIIALAGVVINDSLILIDLINKKRKETDGVFDAVLVAARQRFRPIILTTLTTFVGLAPMMFETSRQALFLVPMAISLGYGIVFATFLTLILIPSLYLINEDIKWLLSHLWKKINS